MPWFSTRNSKTESASSLGAEAEISDYCAAATGTDSALNLLERNFEADKPNCKWVTDVTDFSLFGQKLYLSPILDLCRRDIVSYTIYDHPVLNMVTEMVEKAFKEIPDRTNLILHSDQGWQYQHKRYQWPSRLAQ